ncbi:AhpC/TSA family protein [Mucilaginibacter robiniae]|uniref:AhpC/TSA family protein n=1 Tax=Mucilaginibacter robiniae TaxID=2728022 RepID=A0A7L5E108_9SPHI|nr:TlpA disulfide reductase family protein [Mucilaginibacter robiniae]QJD97060.1 AhpC/TSA family protein [Mucilaginibacter robiniae]
MFKKISLLAAAFLPLAVAAQTPENFTLSGKLSNITQPLKAYMVYQYGATNVIDSATLVNGSFQFSGQVLNPVNAVMALDHKGVGFSHLNGRDDILSFYLEKGNIVLSGTDSLAKAKIAGSPINDENAQLQASLGLINARAKKLYADAQAAPAAQQQSVAYQNQLQANLKVLQKQQEDVLKNFVATHKNSYLSLMALSSLGNPNADVSGLEPLYEGLSQNLKDTEAGKLLHQSLAGLKATAIGTQAPDFTQPDVNGKPVSLSSFKGKYVLIDFWASWCPPCRQENPNVVRVFNKYKTKNFTILGVSLDRPGAKEAWQQAVKSDGLTWTQVSDLKYWQNEAAALYKVQSIPQNFLIDPSGKIIAKNLRGEDLEAKLAELFGKI